MTKAVENKNWILPEAIEEILPSYAWEFEQLKRLTIDFMVNRGYQYVILPHIEFLSSLQAGQQDLEDITFKFTDPKSLKQLGLRADITPQVARIDAMSKNANISRYCYAGEVFRANTVLNESRNPIQVGAEIYGDSSLQADLEIISMSIEMLANFGIKDIVLDINNVAITRKLFKQVALSKLSKKLFEAILRKSFTDLQELISISGMETKSAEKFLSLIELYGGLEILDRAASVFINNDELAKLSDLAYRIQNKYPDLKIHIDLSSLHAYQYHTGVVFSVFTPSLGCAIAGGGRYDEVSHHFDVNRAAIGFSIDLKKIFQLEINNYIKVC